MQMILITINGLAKSRLYDFIKPVARKSGRGAGEKKSREVSLQSPRIGVNEAPSAIEAGSPVAIFQRFDSYAPTARGRMEKTPVSYVDRHVRISTRQRVEKHQIAGF